MFPKPGDVWLYTVYIGIIGFTSSCAILHTGTRTETSEDPEVNMSTNEAYVVSGGAELTEGTENHEYDTIPEQTDGDEYDYVDNHL